MRIDRISIALAALGLALGLTSGPGGAPALAAGELRIANSGEPDTLDPHHLSGTWENRIIGDMFMGLTTEAADGSVIPGAAESWTVSDDGLVALWLWRGTMKGAFLGQAATGRAIAVPAVSAYFFRDGKLAGERVYFDLATLCEQAGLSLDHVRAPSAAA